MKFRLSIAFLLISIFTYSQTEVLFETIKTKSYILNYNTDFGDSQRTINDIIRMISDYSPKNLFNTKVNFRVDENIKITKNHNKVSIWVSFNNIRLDGDIIYKGFDISPSLIPSKFEYSGTLWCEVDSTKTTFSKNISPFNPIDNEIVYTYSDTVKQNRYSFKIDNLNFIYDFDNKNRFGAHLQAIDYYYKADRDLNEFHTRLYKIKTDNIDAYEENSTFLKETSNLINDIERNPFWTILPLNTYDPQKVRSKLIELKNILQDKQRDLSKLRSIIHEKFFEKGYIEYQNKKLNEAKISFNKSLSYFPKYSKSKFFLALIAYDQNNINESESILLEFYKFPNIDDETLNYSYNLVKNIENTKLNNAELLISKELFKDAITVLESMNQFCSQIPKYTCNDDYNKLSTIAHTGIYNSLIQKSQSIFTNGLHQVAIEQIDNALNYQNLNEKWIPNNDEAVNLKKKIYADYYLVLIKDGKKVYQDKNYSLAFSKFYTATNIEKLWDVKVDKQLPELLKKSKLELLLIDANTATKLVSDNNLSKAREILIKIIEEQKTYQLTDNKTLTNEIEKLKKDIFKQECINAQHDYDLKIEQAKSTEISKDFIKALKLYYEAIGISEKKSDCEINMQIAIDGNKRCVAPAQYQTDLLNCKKLVTQLNFVNATQNYVELGNFYLQNKIETFGIIHNQLIQFFQSFGTDYMRFGADYFITKHDYENGLSLLKELMFRNDERSLTKKTQIELAHEMAILDYKNNPNVNYKLKIQEYTKENKYFKYFNKEYKKTIKKIKR